MDRKKYSYDVKKQVVEMYFEGHPIVDIVTKFEISNRRRVHEWVKKVKENGYDALNDTRGHKSKGKSKKEDQTLEEKYERLQLENLYLKKLLDLKRG
jgi:transposase